MKEYDGMACLCHMYIGNIDLRLIKSSSLIIHQQRITGLESEE
jgi:hypothetical protein